MDNSQGQNPCLIAAWLSTPCNPSKFSVVPRMCDFALGRVFTRSSAESVTRGLPPGGQYVGPSNSTYFPCECNTVFYALASGCALCQEGVRIVEYVLKRIPFAHRSRLNVPFRWTTWIEKCTVGTIVIGKYVPAGQCDITRLLTFICQTPGTHTQSDRHTRLGICATRKCITLLTYWYSFSTQPHRTAAKA